MCFLTLQAMKNFIASALLIAMSGATVHAGGPFDDKVFKNPVEYTVPYTNEDCRITDIAINSGFTAISFEFKTGYLFGDDGHNHSLNYNTALVDAATGRRFPLLYTNGYIEKQPFKMIHKESYTTYNFSLVFPTLPADVKAVNLTLEPGLGLSWSFMNIKVGAVKRTADNYTDVVTNPKVAEIYPGVKVLQTMRHEKDVLVFVEFTAPRDFNFRLNPMTAYCPDTKKSYEIVTAGLPRTGKDEPLYFKSGTSDAGVLLISNLPADVRRIDLLENGHPLVKGLSLSD